MHNPPSPSLPLSPSPSSSPSLQKNGFINLHKPLTWTSHDCVARIRRLLNTKKVGHGGTLDPLAQGVLPIAVGRATRLLQYLPEQKAYRATIRFGVTTSTDDLEGDILTQQSAQQLTREAVEAVLPKFVGPQSQTPPMYSAIQVEGKRLYDLARKGKTVEVPSRQIVIHQLQPVEWRPGEHPELIVDVDCGPGTYIRSLARDIGACVETGATLAALTRTHSSGFDMADSIGLEVLEQQLAEGTFVPVAAGGTVAHLDAIALPPVLARRWCMGQKLSLTEPGIVGLTSDQIQRQVPQPPWQPLRIVAAETEQFLGIGEIRALPRIDENGCPAEDLSNVLAPKMVFAAVD